MSPLPSDNYVSAQEGKEILSKELLASLNNVLKRNRMEQGLIKSSKSGSTLTKHQALFLFMERKKSKVRMKIMHRLYTNF